MSGTLYFQIPHKAQGKDRPRLSGKTVYTTEKTKSYEHEVAWRAREAMTKTGFKKIEEGPVMLEIVVSVARTKKSEFGAPVMKPDFDNIAKAIADALNGIAYDDDKQICCHTFQRVWSVTDGVAVCVAPMSFQEEKDL